MAPAYDKEQWRASVENGKIPRVKLAEITPTQWDADLQGPAIMHPEAAGAMSAFLAAADAAGHGGLRVKYSYRTYAKQVEKWNNYQNGGNLAAVPGTSNHGWAVATDLNWNTPGDIEWAHDNCRRFGYLFDVSSENWHCTYQGGYTVDPDREEDMNLDHYIEGEKKYRAKVKELAGKGRKDTDPGAAPKTMRNAYEQAGWNSARFAAQMPKIT